MLAPGARGIVSGQPRAPAALLPKKVTAGAHWIGGGVDFRAGLDILVVRKSLVPAGNQTTVPRSSLTRGLVFKPTTKYKKEISVLGVPAEGAIGLMFSGCDTV